ncbi:guanylate kinase [Gleimia sp. 6138-11-ORH1]|uniref:guanylate kinase n=1 Tax=Gleimia sp. 6138-11-ORH1 TaxID=2973937 RepID=UPI002169AEB9|nr:guanylate kinase [Gleimia sp. 6138-11-ORH1]MCS4484365.1 guanylate kinase [Gleimia sp. 6138-11-ORH1]
MSVEKKPRLAVIAGPTAVGKGTVVRALLEKYPHVYLSVSATTRAPREGEIDGQDYHFLSHEDFEGAIARDEFLEWATVHKVNKYGTLKAPIEAQLAQGVPAILEIDLAGVRQVRQQMPDALFIFIAPPSWEELVKRLQGRGTESAEEMTRRLETAKLELAAKDEFDHIVVNDEVDRTVSELAELLELA